MKTKELKLEKITKVIDPVVAMRDRQWFLVTAKGKEEVGTLTAAWGQIGNVWEKKTMTIYIRPQRHTLPLIEENGCFTCTFFDGHLKEMGYLGSVSGFDEPDKIKKSGLHLTDLNGWPTFEEGKYVLCCKVLYIQQLEPDCFLDKETLEMAYPDKDYSYTIVGEILNAYEVE